MRREIWSQLKNITADEITSALRRDNWMERAGECSSFVYKKDARMVVIHKHPHKTYQPGQLFLLFEDIGWTEEDLKRLKLIR